MSDERNSGLRPGSTDAAIVRAILRAWDESRRAVGELETSLGLCESDERRVEIVAEIIERIAHVGDVARSCVAAAQEMKRKS